MYVSDKGLHGDIIPWGLQGSDNIYPVSAEPDLMSSNTRSDLPEQSYKRDQHSRFSSPMTSSGSVLYVIRRSASSITDIKRISDNTL